MKRLLLALVVALVLWAQPVSAQAVVQFTSAVGGGTATFGVATTAGNLIVVFIGEFYSVTTYGLPSTPNDGTNTYVSAYSHDNGGGGFSPSLVVKYAENAGSVSSLTVNDGAGQYSFVAVEVSGVPTSSTLDQAGGYLLNSSTTNYASGSVTTTQAAEILFGIHVSASNTGGLTATPTAGWTNAVTLPTVQDPQLQVQYKVVSSTGSYSSTGTYSASRSTIDNAIVTFKASGGGPPPSSSVPCTLRLLGVGCHLQ